MKDIYLVFWECEDGKYDVWSAHSKEEDAERELANCKKLFDNSSKSYKCYILTEYLIGD